MSKSDIGNKGIEQLTKEFVRMIWEMLSNFKCILAIRFVANNGKVMIQYPLAFWVRRESVINKLLHGIVFNPTSCESRDCDSLVVGTSTQKIIAITVAPAATLLIVYNGNTSAENIAAMIALIKAMFNTTISFMLYRK